MQPMVRLVLIALASLLLLGRTAYAAGVCRPGTLCSRTFYAAGPCSGLDELATLRHQNDETSKLVEPWETAAISIVGYRLVGMLPPNGLQYVLPGDSYAPDIIGGIGADRLTGGEFFPKGLGFPFPAKGTEVEAHLDLHYSCNPHADVPAYRFQAFYVVYYTIDAAAEQR